MKGKVFAFAAVIALCATFASAEMVWDAVQDFSVTQPANGAWSYGYGEGAVWGGAFDMSFGTDTEGGWTRSMDGAPDYSPYMWCNKTDAVGTYPAQSLNLSSGTGGGDYHILVRWTAPAAGDYQVDAVFKMMTDAGGTPWPGEMDVQVAVNGTVDYYDFVSGFDWSQYSGAWPTYAPGPKTYSHTYTLAAGDTVDFVGGIGWVNANSDFVNIAGSKVTAVPEPGTLALLGFGLIGLAVFARRNRK
jgi:hypothetical protein